MEDSQMGDRSLPLVSVIIPTYNRAHTLPLSIGSVLNQTYKNLELIVMDDGSEDGTEEYVRNIADNRVRYWRNETNMGPSAARNRGAELAKGEYLAFQDSDDEWMPEKLGKQMRRMLAEEEISLVYCEFGLYLDGRFLLTVPPRTIPDREKEGNLFSYFLLYPLISTQTIVVKREEFIREQGFNTALKAYEDFEFTLRYAKDHKIGFVQEPLVKVNSSPGSVNKRFDERIRAQFYMAGEMLGALRERDLLWRKIEIISQEAETHKCFDVFIEELTRLSQDSLSSREQETASLFLDKMRYSKEILPMKKALADGLAEIRQGIVRIYAQQFEEKREWSEKERDLIQQFLSTIGEYPKWFAISEEAEDSYNRVLARCGEENLSWIDQLYLLTDIAELLEMLEKCIAGQIEG